MYVNVPLRAVCVQRQTAFIGRYGLDEVHPDRANVLPLFAFS